MITSRPFVWGAILGLVATWYLTGRCPSCGRRNIDPGAILAHGPVQP